MLGMILAVATGQAYWRGAFGLDPAHPVDHPPEDLWLINARVLLFAFAMALAVAWAPKARWVTDTLLGLLFGLNIVIPGIALGAYGWIVGGWHFVPETLAMVVAIVAYLDARRTGRVSWQVLGCCVVGAAVLLWLAALLESTSG